MNPIVRHGLTALVRHGWRHLLLATGAGLVASAGWAVPLSHPNIEMSIWGIQASDPFGPGKLLGVATQDVAVNGEVTVKEVLGTQGLGIPASVAAYATEDGKRFWVYASTPDNYQRPVEFIGSRATLRIEQTFRKDDPDAYLRYTFNRLLLEAYVNPEFGPGCTTGQVDCLQGLMMSAVEVRDASGHLVWMDNNAAGIASLFGASAYETTLFGTWPWSVNDNKRPVFIDTEIGLVGDSVTRTLDLGDIDLGETFTVVHSLSAWAIDQASHVGLFRGVLSTSQDPQDGDTGANLDWSGLTPVGANPAPEPASVALVLLALAGAAAAGHHRQHHGRVDHPARRPAPARTPDLRRWRLRPLGHRPQLRS